VSARDNQRRDFKDIATYVKGFNRSVNATVEAIDPSYSLIFDKK
jgi:hypothetical protein